MSTWNYRVCKETYNKGAPYEEIGYTIREAYYTASGEIWGVTEVTSGLYGDNLDDIKDGLRKMHMALDKDVIDLDTIIFAKLDQNDGINWDEVDNDNFQTKYAEELKNKYGTID